MTLQAISLIPLVLPPIVALAFGLGQLLVGQRRRREREHRGDHADR